MDERSGGTALLDNPGDDRKRQKDDDAAGCCGRGFPVIADTLPPRDPPAPFIVGSGPINNPPHVRWMIRRDLPEVVAIEKASFEFPWTDEEFQSQLRRRNAIGMVADLDDVVVGYMIYEIHKSRLHLLNFAVHPDFRRQGVGTVMIDKIKSKLNPSRRHRVMLEVRETNLDAQLWLRSQGFRAVSILRDFYDDAPEDAYVMQYRVAALEAA